MSNMKNSLKELTKKIDEKTLDEHSQDNFHIPKKHQTSIILFSLLLTILITFACSMFYKSDEQPSSTVEQTVINK